MGHWLFFSDAAIPEESSRRRGLDGVPGLEDEGEVLLPEDHPGRVPADALHVNVDHHQVVALLVRVVLHHLQVDHRLRDCGTVQPPVKNDRTSHATAEFYPPGTFSTDLPAASVPAEAPPLTGPASPRRRHCRTASSRRPTPLLRAAPLQLLQLLQLQQLLLLPPALSSALLACSQSHFFPPVFLRTLLPPGRHRCRPGWRTGSDPRPPEAQEAGQV